jgi:head-tail adaptor
MRGAGTRTRRITIERLRDAGRNAMNEAVEDWFAFITVLAERRDFSDVSKVEYLSADQVGAFQLSRFVILSSAASRTVTPSDRIAYDGAIWNIKGVKETAEGRNRFLEITAARTVNGAV